MFTNRRRQIAWLFTLVLVLELAVLCCASAHISDHICHDCATCAICACVRGGLRRAALVALLAAALAVMSTARAHAPIRRRTSRGDSLIARRVRLND